MYFQGKCRNSATSCWLFSRLVPLKWKLNIVEMETLWAAVTSAPQTQMAFWVGIFAPTSTQLVLTASGMMPTNAAGLSLQRGVQVLKLNSTFNHILYWPNLGVVRCSNFADGREHTEDACRQCHADDERYCGGECKWRAEDKTCNWRRKSEQNSISTVFYKLELYFYQTQVFIPGFNLWVQMSVTNFNTPCWDLTDMPMADEDIPN